jgi:hypothetical protein
VVIEAGQVVGASVTRQVELLVGLAIERVGLGADDVEVVVLLRVLDVGRIDTLDALGRKPDAVALARARLGAGEFVQVEVAGDRLTVADC